MSDANLFWGGDLSPNPTGDVLLAANGPSGQQRILRRLLTNPGDYIWQPNYGAGIGQFVGKPCNVQQIKATIRSQIFQEGMVARSPEPVIYVEVSRDGSVYVKISYVASSTGTSQVLYFNVSA